MLTPILTHRRYLSEGQRRELVELIAGKPHLTDGHLARIFESRTGRRIASASVRKIRLRGYRSTTAADRRRPLSEAERVTLERCCHRGAPVYDRRTIAQAFEVAAGRPIHPTTVGRFLTRHFEDYRREVAWN